MTPLTCDQVVKQFFVYLDRALSGEPLDQIEEHLEECLSCCDKLAFSRQVDAFVKARVPEGKVPEGFEARVRQALERAAGRE